MITTAVDPSIAKAPSAPLAVPARIEVAPAQVAAVAPIIVAPPTIPVALPTNRIIEETALTAPPLHHLAPTPLLHEHATLALAIPAATTQNTNAPDHLNPLLGQNLNLSHPQPLMTTLPSHTPTTTKSQIPSRTSQHPGITSLPSLPANNLFLSSSVKASRKR
jgi:hypothetical protein